MKIHYFWVLFFIFLYENVSFAQSDSLMIHFEIGNEYKAKREYLNAITSYSKAIDSELERNDLDSVFALITHQQGLCYYRLGNYKSAIDSWEQSIDHKIQFLPTNHIDIINPKINVASGYMELLFIKQAREELQECLQLILSNQEDEAYHLSRIYQKLGVVENVAGNPVIALNYLLQAFHVREKLFMDNPVRLTEIAIEIFDVYKTLERHDETLHWSQKALYYVEQNIDKDESYLRDKANIHNNIAIAYTNLNQLEKAEQEIKESLKINQSLDDGVQFLAINYSNLITIYMEQEKFDLAFNYIEKAKSLLLTSKNYEQYLPELFLDEGDVYRRNNALIESIQSYQTALDYLIVNRKLAFISDNPMLSDVVLGNYQILMEGLYKKAHGLFDLYKINRDSSNLKDAYATCQTLFKYIAQKRQLYSDFDLNQFISKQAKAYYSLGIDIQYEYYKHDPNSKVLDEFIYLNNQSKSALLFKALSQNVKESENKLFIQLLQKEKTLTKQISDAEIEMWNDIDHHVLSKDSVMQWKVNLHQLRDSIRNSIAFTESRMSSEITSVVGIQNQIIEKNEIIFEYFESIEVVYLFAITASEMTVHRIENVKELQSKILRYLKLVRDHESPIEMYSKFGFELYETLISKHVSISDDIDQIRIIPDGVISMIPFESLIYQYHNETQFKNLSYLLNKYFISYASSLSVLQFQNEENKSQNTNHFIGFASDFSSSTNNSLQVMKGALEEVESVSARFEGTLQLNKEATKSNFIAKAPDYNIVHVSLHGFANIENPMLSYIQFDTVDSLEFENRLYANQIYDVKVPVELLMLSACETGIGQFVKGEGVMSLAHAFSYAGAKSIGMSLWNIPVHTTSNIISTFYKSISNGTSKTEALRSSKLHYIKSLKADELAHPFYWAPLVIYGNQNPINEPSTYNIWFIVLGTCTIIFLVYFILLKRTSASAA